MHPVLVRDQSPLRSHLVLLCRQILHPLIRILVRFGVSAGELKSIVDNAYAQVGSDYLRQRGERVTYSRLAVITGINRSFLPALLSKPQDEFHPRSGTQLHRAARVLDGWHDDVRFQTSAGSPALLTVHGGRRSFQALAKRYSGGVYYPLLLSELVASGAVKRVGADRVRAVRRAVSAGGASLDSLEAAAETAGDLLSTLEHNLTAKPSDQLPVRSLALQADMRSLPLFRVRVGKRADALLEALDAFLQAHRVPPESASEPEAPALTLGAAVFAICRPRPTVMSAPVPPPRRHQRRARRS